MHWHLTLLTQRHTPSAFTHTHTHTLSLSHNIEKCGEGSLGLAAIFIMKPRMILASYQFEPLSAG